jgi:hypothetical protein
MDNQVREARCAALRHTMCASEQTRGEAQARPTGRLDGRKDRQTCREGCGGVLPHSYCPGSGFLRL